MPSDRFSALLSPLRVRGKTMKTRFMYPVAQAHYIQGPEEYPADPVVQYYCSFARQGQSLIITQELTNLEQRQMSFGDQPHFALYDMDNPACQNYFTQLAYFIHFYGALCGFNLNYDNRLPYCINDPAKTTDIGAGGMGGPGGMPGGMPGGPGGMPGGMPGGPGGMPGGMPGGPGGMPGGMPGGRPRWNARWSRRPWGQLQQGVPGRGTYGRVYQLYVQKDPGLSELRL